MPARIAFAPGDAGWRAFAAMRDLWADKPIASATRELMVPAHGAVLLRVRGR